MTPTRTLIATALVGLSLGLSACSDSSQSLLTKAKQSLEKQDGKAAEIHLKNLLQKEDLAEARFLLAEAHVANGDLRAAEKEYTKAIEGGFDKTRAGLGLIDTHMQLGEFAKALTLAATVSPSAAPDQARLQTLMGRAYLATGKREDAEKAFQAALTAIPDHPPARVAQITVLASTDLKAASEQIDALLAKKPDDLAAQSLKGDLELAQGRIKEATAILEKVAAKDPKDRNVRAKLASVASDTKDYTGAQKWLDELKKLTGPAPGTMYLQALNDFRQGKNEAARDAVQASLKGAPNYLPAVALASSVSLAMNSFEQAEAHARLVTEKAPNSTLGPRLLGATYLKMNSPDRALQAVQPYLDKGAKDPILWGIAGEAALKLNEPDRAANFFKKSTELAPTDLNQKTGLGLAKIAAGDRDAGIAELEKAAEGNTAGGMADFALITQHLRDRQWDKALAAIDRLDKKQPNSAMVSNLRGTVMLGKNDIAGARKYFEAALKIDPKFFAATSNLAALDLRDKKIDDAKKRYTTLLENDPKNVRAMLTLAQIIEGTGGEKAQVLDWLKKAREADKTSVPATLALSRHHLAQNQPKEALPILQEAVTAAPESIELLDALGTAQLRAGDESQAIRTFEKILRAKPDSAPLQLRMGEFYLGRKEYDRAMTYFRKAAELAPKAIEPKAAIATVHVLSGRIAEARAIAAALQREAPKSAAGVVLDGDILAYDKKPLEAAAAYRRALGLQKSVPISAKLHRSLLAANKDADADAVLNAMLSDYPKDINAKSYVAMAEISQKHWAKAIPLYREVIAVQPNSALALNNLAWALNEMKDPAALQTAERAVALAPKAPAILDTYGAILMTQGNHKKAVDTLRQAVALAPKATETRLRLAEALVANGDKSDARKELDQVIAEAKSGPFADRASALKAKL